MNKEKCFHSIAFCESYHSFLPTLTLFPIHPKLHSPPTLSHSLPTVPLLYPTLLLTLSLPYPTLLLTLIPPLLTLYHSPFTLLTYPIPLLTLPHSPTHPTPFPYSPYPHSPTHPPYPTLP